MEEHVRILLGGDLMLGRLVKEKIIECGHDYPLGNISALLKQGDVTVANLESPITDSSHTWTGERKPYYFSAPSNAVNSLQAAGIDIVNLANNHILDFHYQGLLDTLDFLQSHHILFAGAGRNHQEALRPTIFKKKALTIGMVGFCDHQPDFVGTETHPGMAYLNINNPNQALTQLRDALNDMKKEGVNLPIVSLHWGQAKAEAPSQYLVRIAHNIIDMGYKIVFGHGAHVFHGVEIYKGCPIIYAAGDLVNDYSVDKKLKNDHQVVFELVYDATSTLLQVHLYPIFIDYCQAKLAKGASFDFIADRASTVCQPFGTHVKREGHQRLVLENNISRTSSSLV